MASVLMLLTSTGACGQRNTSDNWGKLSAIDLILPRLLSPSCRYRGPASPETPTRRSPFLDISLNTERATHATGGRELNRKHITALDVQPRPVLTANQWHERLTNVEHH